MKMAEENKIGDIISYQGEQYVVTEANERRSYGNRFIGIYFPCEGCAFKNYYKHGHSFSNKCKVDNFTFGPCDEDERKDKKNVIFKKIVSEK